RVHGIGSRDRGSEIPTGAPLAARDRSRSATPPPHRRRAGCRPRPPRGHPGGARRPAPALGHLGEPWLADRRAGHGDRRRGPRSARAGRPALLAPEPPDPRLERVTQRPPRIAPASPPRAL